jgi:hypothetical protein
MKDIKEDFVKYVKEQFDYDISFKQSSTPDTFESVFGGTFSRIHCPYRHKNGNCLSVGGFCTSVNDIYCKWLHENRR